MMTAVHGVGKRRIHGRFVIPSIYRCKRSRNRFRSNTQNSPQNIGGYTVIFTVFVHVCVCVFVCAGITILLSLSVFQLIVAEMVPSTSMAVPLVGNHSHQARSLSLSLSLSVQCSNYNASICRDNQYTTNRTDGIQT